MNKAALTISQRATLLFHSQTARKISTLIAIVFTFVILGALINHEKETLLNHRWTINWIALLVAFVLYSLALLLASSVWVRIINSLGMPIRFGQHFHYYCISMLAKRLPGTIWYVVYRSQMYEREGLSPKLTSLASGVELAVVIISGIMVSILFAAPILLEYQAGIWVILLLLFIGLSFLHPQVIKWFMQKLNLQSQVFSYLQVILWLGMYVLVRLLSGALVFSIANIIYPLPFDQIDYVVGGWSLVGVLSNILMFMPTNLGFTEVSFSLILSKVIPSSMAVLVAVLSRITITTFELVWAFIGLTRKYYCFLIV